MKRSRYAIIVAGGKGTRMGIEIPKQFLEVFGKPIIVYTIDAFVSADREINLIVVLPADQFETFGQIQSTHLPNLKIQLVAGGKERYDSVKAGLKLIQDKNSFVAIHDAVRPCIDPAIILHSFESAELHGSGVVCVNLKDSIREILPTGKTVARNRSDYFLVQTPQTFRTDVFIQTMSGEYRPEFTDDASVMEHFGHEIQLVKGSYRNIKITTREDLVFVAGILKKNPAD
jgi:2-C-methyl-D-erythritol 4-phosphate cytidylyltransferase